MSAVFDRKGYGMLCGYFFDKLNIYINVKAIS